jgi:hypothetical protein
VEAPTPPQPATQAPAVTPVSIPASDSVQPPVSLVQDPPSDPVPLAGSAAPSVERGQGLETSGTNAIETAPRVSIEPPASGAPSLADIAALVNALPAEPQQAAPPPPSTRTAEPTRIASARSTERRASRPQTLPPANPSRHWVQIAGGVDRASLPREFARLRALAPQQLGRRTAFTAPLRTTNRLLVGPFASAREAQDFVNQLARHNVEAFAWTSAAGQEIDRLAAR